MDRLCCFWRRTTWSAPWTLNWDQRWSSVPTLMLWRIHEQWAFLTQRMDLCCSGWTQVNKETQSRLWIHRLHCRGFQLWHLLQLWACSCYILTAPSFYCSDCSRIHLFQNGFQSSIYYLSIKTAPIHFHYCIHDSLHRLLPHVLKMKFDILPNTIVVLTNGNKQGCYLWIIYYWHCGYTNKTSQRLWAVLWLWWIWQKVPHHSC